MYPTLSGLLRDFTLTAITSLSSINGFSPSYNHLQICCNASFFFGCTARGILFIQQGIKPKPLLLEGHSLNHRENRISLKTLSLEPSVPVPASTSLLSTPFTASNSTPLVCSRTRESGFSPTASKCPCQSPVTSSLPSPVILAHSLP